MTEIKTMVVKKRANIKTLVNAVHNTYFLFEVYKSSIGQIFTEYLESHGAVIIKVYVAFVTLFCYF